LLLAVILIRFIDCFAVAYFFRPPCMMDLQLQLSFFSALYHRNKCISSLESRR